MTDLPVVRVIETPTLGDRSYLVHDGRHAFVVDPQRDIDRVLALAEEEQVTVTDVFETHIHNDYVTGGLALARETEARYHVSAGDDVHFVRNPLTDGSLVRVGELEVRAIATPGHTFTHLSYALEQDGQAVAVFTGGSLLYGATGRPDLLGDEHTETLARLQHGSARRLAAELPGEAQVYPTHGFGSFCSATQTDSVAKSTIAREVRANPVLARDIDAYVAELVSGLDAYPAYYAAMGPANAAGPDAPDLSLPGRLAAPELRRRIEAGEWIVDLRHRTAFAAGHVPGTLNFGLDGQFSTYLGWLRREGVPVSLVGPTAADVAKAQRELVRIGVDRVEGIATGSPHSWSTRPLGSYATGSFGDLAAANAQRAIVVLDVRRSSEYATGHLDGAVNVPLHDLPHRLSEVSGDEIWVHCASGYRAAIAASLLSAAGRRVVHVDDQFENASLAVERESEVPGVSAPDAARAVSAGAALIDVRELSEWRGGHVPGARHLPLGLVDGLLGELPEWGPTVGQLHVICRSGNRSAEACRRLAAGGVAAVNVTGGMLAWVEAGLPVAAPAGTGNG